MRYGYSYREAIALPAWLFWGLADASAFELTEIQRHVFEAASMAFGGMGEERLKAIAEYWTDSRKRVIPEIKKPESLEQFEQQRRKKTPPKMTPERLAAWRGVMKG
jgi:hypothetical protein